MNKIVKIAVIILFSRAFEVVAAPALPGLSILSMDNFLGLGDFSGAVGNLGGVGQTVLTNPAPLLGIATDTGLPLLQGVAPILEVLIVDPAALPIFFLDGGTILAPSLSGVPPVPLLNRELGVL